GCNTAFLRDIAENILAARADVSVAGYLAFGPPEYRSFFQAAVPDEIGLIEAWQPRFGDCLALTALELLQKHQGAILLNCDSPTLPTSVLVESARALMQPGDRMVFGPARDGGYYCLGLKASTSGYSRTFPGAPSTWRRRPWRGPQSWAFLCILCRSGMTWMTAKASSCSRPSCLTAMSMLRVCARTRHDIRARYSFL